MALSVQGCLDKLKAAHPDLYPQWYIEDRGVYLVNMLQRGVPKEESMANFYAVDPEKETVAGPVPVMMIYGNPELQKKLEKPHMCSPEEQKTLQQSLSMTDSDFLMHYGIKGQKWGIRRFQNEDGSLTQEGKKRYGSGDEKGKDEKKESKESEKASDDAPKEKMGFFEKRRLKEAQFGDKWFEAMTDDSDAPNREKTKEGGLDKDRLATDVLFTVLNPFNAAVLAADGVGAVVANKRMDNYLKNREKKSDLDPETGLYIKKEGSYNEKQDLAAVNPAYMNMNTNTKNNCMLCTTTYEMRRRGYDVTAQLDSQGYNFNDLKRWFPKAKIEKTDRYDENGRPLKQQQYIQKTLNNLVKQGDGARGNMMVLFRNGSGAHSIFYEVQNGKVIFKDGQTGMVMSNKMSLLTATMSPEVFLSNTTVNSYARLDNVKPDLERIKAECVR